MDSNVVTAEAAYPGSNASRKSRLPGRVSTGFPQLSFEHGFAHHIKDRENVLKKIPYMSTDDA
jgi:hypothetical protein